jgi:ubiquinone biosynthesis protein UbiJ
MTQSSMLATPLITYLNHLVNQSNPIRQQLQSYADKTVCFHIEPLIRLYIRITSEGHFKTTEACDKYSAATLNIPAELVPRLVFGDHAAFHEIAIDGNTELANSLLCIGKMLQLKIEENFSPVIGDVFARRVMLMGHELVRWHLGNTHYLSRALIEFITEEQPIAVNHTQFRRSDPAIDTLQQQILLLEKKINSLISSPSTINNQSLTNQ